MFVTNKSLVSIIIVYKLLLRKGTKKMVDYKLERELTTISGQQITELHLDFEALSMADLKTAQRISGMVADGSNIDVMSTSPRLDSNLRIGIAWVAAIKGTKGLQVNDVLGIGLKDAVCLSELCLSDYLFR